MIKFVAILSAFVVLASAAPPVTQEPIPIVNQDSEVNPDGSYSNSFESGNGIKAQEHGYLKAVDKDEVLAVEGEVTWTDDDGHSFHINYIADENGFQPQGDHLPTPPPQPEYVNRLLEYNAAHPEEDEMKH